MTTDTASVTRSRPASQVRLPRWWPAVVLLGPTLLLLVGLYLIPLAIVLSRSFTDPTVGLENYVALWKIAGFRNHPDAGLRPARPADDAADVVAFDGDRRLLRAHRARGN